MLRRKVVLGLAVCIVAMLLVSQSFSAAGGGGRGGRGGGQRGQRPGAGTEDRNPEQMRARMQEMMDQRMKEQLGITGDDEWKVIQPRLQKVQELSRQANAGGRMAMFGGRGGQGGRGQGGRGQGGRGQGGGPGQGGEAGARPGATDRELSAVEKAAQVLQDLLATESPKADDIKAKLTAYRTVKETAKKDLAKAQQDLKQIVTVKQEATLVLMGMLN